MGMNITDTLYKGIQWVTMEDNPTSYDFFWAFCLLFATLVGGAIIVLGLTLLLVELWPVSFIGLAILLVIISLFFHTYITHKE
jgi:hypothetical protein